MDEESVFRYMCKKIKFDHPNKWYMHNPLFGPENEVHNILWILI